MSQPLTIIINQLDQEIVNLSMTTLTRILALDEKIRMTALSLYVFYCKTAKRQKTASIYATDSFCRTGLGVGRDRFDPAKKALVELGIIEERQGKSEDGKFTKKYVFVHYLARDSRLSDFPQAEFPASGETATNALDKKGNALDKKRKRYTSPKDIKEEEIQSLATQFQVPTNFVTLKRENLIDYCESTGKRYKNYLATLRNWVRRDSEEYRQKHPTSSTFIDVTQSRLGGGLSA